MDEPSHKRKKRKQAHHVEAEIPQPTVDIGNRKEEAETEEAAESERQQTNAVLEDLPETQNDVGRGRKWTVAIAVPASILNNATSPEMRSYFAGW